MPKVIEGKIDASGLKFAIVTSRFNEFITAKLLEGCLDCLLRHGASDQHISIIKVPGSFEIPLIAQKAAQTKQYDAVICLGAVIRGQTPHFEYVASEVTKGIASIQLELGVPIAYGIITSDNIEQAIERAGTKLGNKGWDAAISAIEMANVLKAI
ncbi:MAG: 6,7-dimethyl-8-ribityllumazine synthase [Candidatus Schekmanbacteria bacterium RIFCSPHIGHO2_02_FULL_38_11]|uniref:6,7-dimethyl-8-ribityllumazine synthase n=1 Tax=Candidatus Schekmanbacteria bacterium RIFCSPLOWO2_12_FULL_38_15 TaxID=1817883 RepID=A0A1F7SEG9_9BACT|nr:MAG: 6,7-dimethyl-8-ribityllumazine synthase [Candidatus Schekmanbacteria bacterium GWA2_38_9]OGL49470.1 MAG: 6,7-dimethyl-8-ribityllumazine synthase [Candidatus Schekmanbacteria bacterium RIFCSPLOWO2_02_FULL_38_14]OGL52165.1 MAG: 6,7-dimethyl-8-ribityllumazine synthase [Candidatus Schekmanbacteria bacterium RIFCSPLOWO2_12_FULL_38_15]OGL53580.1 MAG: 6,7-dimethyl-8-ribityllumazine synthase [Candidatus Schekmanbacteria bacterium RIFCSPHIGHO2_02_FULL_38_11]